MSADGTLTCKNIKATNGTFSGKVSGSTISGSEFEGGSISTGLLFANDDSLNFGEFVVYNEGRTFQAGDFKVTVGPGGTDPIVKTYLLQCYDVSFDHPYAEGMTAIEMFEQLYEYAKENRRRIEDLEGSI